MAEDGENFKEFLEAPVVFDDDELLSSMLKRKTKGKSKLEASTMS